MKSKLAVLGVPSGCWPRSPWRERPNCLATATPQRMHVSSSSMGHPWIACRATFEPDAQSREAILQMTLGMVRNASCGADVRLERKGLVGTYLVGGVLELEPHEVFCDLQIETFLLPSVKIMVAPKVTFLNQTVTDVSLGIVSIADVPPFVVASISDAAEWKPSADSSRRR